MDSDDASGQPVSPTETTARLVHAVGHAGDLVLLLDDHGRIIYANDRAVATYDYPREALLGLTIHDLDPDFPSGTWAQHWASLKRCGHLTINVRHLTAQGRALPVEVTDTWIELDGHEYSIVIARDLSGRADVDERAQLTKFSIDRIDESVFWIGPNARVIYANDAACRNLGYASDELIGMAIDELDPNFPSEIWPLHWEELKERQRLHFETHHRRRDGSVYPVEVTANFLKIGEREFNCAFSRDITERRVTEGQLRRMATHDALTGLPNRTLLTDRVDRALAHAARDEKRLAVLLLNIDRMQKLNLQHGHAVGDRVIQHVAKRLGSPLRGIDTVAHWGGDTFVVLSPELAQPEHAGEIAHKLLDGLHVPLVIDGERIALTASVGIALYPQDGHDAQTLFKNADIAMYRAKEFGGHTVQYFSADLHPDTAERIRTLLDLRRAVANGDLQLHYLPFVDLDERRPAGLEALVRWHRAPEGLLRPAAFLDTAEETGYILELGAHILDLACAQLATWRDDGLAIPPVTLNVTSRQLRDDTFAERVAAALERHRLEPAHLQFDLPPQLLYSCPASIATTLERLAGLGVPLGVDDVGRDPVDLALLQELPLALIKLDAGLFEASAGNPALLTRLAALAGAAQRLGVRVLAEGLSDAGAIDRARELGCEFGQGLEIGAAMEAGECTNWLARAATDPS